MKTLVASEGEDELVRTPERMREEAAETEQRCTARTGQVDGKKTAILEKARRSSRRRPR